MILRPAVIYGVGDLTGLTPRIVCAAAYRRINEKHKVHPARVRACVRVFVCLRACVCACMRACMRTCVHVCVHASVCACL